MGHNEHTIEYVDGEMFLEPAFGENSTVICFCTSNEYAPYCGITIQSIISNSGYTDYDIMILEHDISERNKKLLLSLVEDKSNFSIRFINMTSAMEQIKIKTWAHFSPVACFKLFLLSNAFSKYKKVLALDTDLIFQKDVADLFHTDIADYYMAAVDDVIMKKHVYNDKNTSGFAPFMPVRQYLTEYLNLGSDEKYYNTGVALLNLSKCRKHNFFHKSLTKLKMKGYTYQEQDVLNEICGGSVMDLDPHWNVVGAELKDDICAVLEQPLLDLYLHSLDEPYVMHFAGGLKPWIYNNSPYSELFFRYAKKTPWYESIMVKMSLNYANYVRSSVISIVRYENTFRFKLKKLVNKIFPENSFRRKALRKVFPRGRGIRELLRKGYNALCKEHSGNRISQFKNNFLSLKLHSIYSFNLQLPIRQKFILLDSKNGTDLAGNIFRLLEELHQPEYREFKLFLTYQEFAKSRVQSILKRYHLDRVSLVEWRSAQYFRMLARCKFLATDLYMPSEYIKRDRQILISTAHGTPIKVMGRDCHTETQGHLQRTHTLADYQTFPSQYMKEKLFHGFMENHLFTGHALKSGYPRNIIFFHKERRKALRDELQWTGKKVIAYLPTFRGIAGDFKSREQANYILDVCSQLDEMLSDHEIFLVKLHNFNTMNLDFSQMAHVKAFPPDYEAYDVLNAVDVLVSDYSSVIFDFLNTRKKIILFQYDYEDYMNSRGMYLKWSDLPFPVAEDVETLYQEIISEKNYDDTDAINQYCTFDTDKAAANICKTIFKREMSCTEFEHARNGKKNILLYAGAFDLRSPTTFEFQEYIKRLNLETNNYFLYFYEYDLFSRAYMLEFLPQSVQYISFLSYPDYTLFEKLKIRLCRSHNKSRLLQKAYKRECQKCFSSLPIDLFIDLSGRNVTVSEIAANLPCKKGIVVHKDSQIPKSCYEKYDVLLMDSDEEILSFENCKKVLQLKKGYSPETFDENAALIERLCNE